jgi:hypothetical protein
VIGKTHRNGLVNDYTRGYLALSLSLVIGEATGESPPAVRAHSLHFLRRGRGSPFAHYVVFTVDADAAPPTGKALEVGIAFTPQLNPEDIGRQRQIDLTAAAGAHPVAAANIVDPADTLSMSLGWRACFVTWVSSRRDSFRRATPSGFARLRQMRGLPRRSRARKTSQRC